MGWILVPCLISLRNEFNAIAPDRDVRTDGSIGDRTHELEPSDHNPDESGQGESDDADNIDEVHAIDVDVDLRKPGWSMQKACNIIVDRHRAGTDDRLKYVIYNRRIAGIESGWQWVWYEGSNPHTDHAHFSSRYDTASERNTGPWGLLADEKGDDDMDLTEHLYGSGPVNDSWKRRFTSENGTVQADTVKNALVFAAVYAKDAAVNSAALLEAQKETNVLLRQLVEQGKKK